MKASVCHIAGETLGSLEEVYRQLDAQLAFPRYFGNNLDALWDVLSTDVEGPFEIVWNNADISRQVLGADFDRVLAVLRQLESERKDFTLTVVG